MNEHQLVLRFLSQTAPTLTDVLLRRFHPYDVELSIQTTIDDVITDRSSSALSPAASAENMVRTAQKIASEVLALKDVADHKKKPFRIIPIQ
jgi:hypothetical protein